MNDFDKRFALAFFNSFMNIKFEMHTVLKRRCNLTYDHLF